MTDPISSGLASAATHVHGMHAHRRPQAGATGDSKTTTNDVSSFGDLLQKLSQAATTPSDKAKLQQLTQQISSMGSSSPFNLGIDTSKISAGESLMSLMP